MKKDDDVLSFIRSHAPAAKVDGERRYTVGQIKTWLKKLPLDAYAIIHLNDPHDGIAAVTTRNDTRADRGRGE